MVETNKYQNPSVEDLRQLYVYGEYFNAERCALIYPGQGEIISGSYYKTDGDSFADRRCSVITIPIKRVMRDWQLSIANNVRTWIGNDTGKFFSMY